MRTLIKNILSVLMILGLSTTAKADDIDIINSQVPILSNVLFVMDLSGSMNADLLSDKLPVPPAPSRLDDLKGAFQDVIADSDFDDINIGLSVFSGDAQSGKGESVAHGITYPVAPLIGKKAQDILTKSGANPFIHKGISYMPSAGALDTREYLTTLSSDPIIWGAGGQTPIVDALFEASRYFKGNDVYWGRRTAEDIRAAHPATYEGLLENKNITPVCDAPSKPFNNRIACTKGVNCGITQDCRIGTEWHTFPDTSTGTNCTPITNNRTMCGESVTSCGTGLNCSPQPISSLNHTCESSYTTISACQAAHPTWEACKNVPKYKYEYDLENTVIGKTLIGNQISCIEKRERYYCDAPDTYSCEINVEKCTRCPGPIPTVVGNAVYKTPIIEKCPANGIVLLSDGRANINKSYNLIPPMIGSYANGCNTKGDIGERCGVELAKYMANEDQNTSIDDKQSVLTFTVGLSLAAGSQASVFLENLANAGNGSFVNAKNRAQLTQAFKQIILSLGKKARSFSAPTYTINTANQLSHGKYVYVPVFDAKTSVAWDGNLKKYQMKNGELYGLNTSSALVPALDSFGKLKVNVQDLWSKVATGDVITTGGAGSLLDPTKRKLYTNNGTATVLADISSVSSAKLNAKDATEKAKLIDYIKGKDTKGNPRHHMGDIIHSKPVMLPYSSSESVLFVGTNEGFLHAIKTTEDITDTTDGNELFAFMPDVLLKNIKTQFENNISGNHLYGADGPITLWHDDKNHDGIKNKGEDAYLYFGLRRGGSAYYALKLGDSISDKPTLAWKIDNKTSGFSNLGFTWSKPVITNLRYKKSGSDTKKPVPVLVFGGGYVDDHSADPKVSSAKNVKGSSVYIVNALNGDKIYSTASADIQFAVPAKVRVIDADRNGSMDRLYFGDTGGNVWRIDLGDKTDYLDMNKSTITHFAELGDNTVVNGPNSRKFFTEPDVAFMKYKGRYALSVSIGSGSRPDPLNNSVENHFFVMFDENVFTRPKKSPKFKTIQMTDLLNAPVSATKDVIANLKKAGSPKGWKMNLKPAKSLTGLMGEKVLSTALTYDNKIMFTTLGLRNITPVTYNKVECAKNNKTEGRLYVLDLMRGNAVIDLDGDKTVADPADRSVSLVGGEILGTPQITYKDFLAKDGSACKADDCVRDPIINPGKTKSFDLSTIVTAKNKKTPANKKLPRVYWLDKEK